MASGCEASGAMRRSTFERKPSPVYAAWYFERVPMDHMIPAAIRG